MKKDLSPRRCKNCLELFSPKPGIKLRVFCSNFCGKRFDKRSSGTNHRKRARRYGVTYETVNRFTIFERDGWKCQVCGRAPPRRWVGSRRPNAPELDHRVPMAQGGAHTYANVQCACRACNIAKGGDRVVGQLPLLSCPGRPAQAAV